MRESILLRCFTHALQQRPAWELPPMLAWQHRHRHRQHRHRRPLRCFAAPCAASPPAPADTRATRSRRMPNVSWRNDSEPLRYFT